MNDALHIDFETRSPLDLKEVGLHRYARHPDTSPWCMAWAVGDEDPQLWNGVVGSADAALQHVAAGRPVYAHNAGFELEIWNEIMAVRFGWPRLCADQTYCTMAMCFAMSLPGALENAAPALGLEERKDAEGHALMLRMARPRSRDPLVWWTEPEKLARLYEYCKQDVRVERALLERLMPLSSRERKLWLLDYKINQRGVRVDMESVSAAIDMAEVIKTEASAAMSAITGGAVAGVSKVEDLKTWMAGYGVEVDSVAKQAVVDLLAASGEDEVSEALPAPVRNALLLRQEVGKASAAKFDVMQARAGEDGRLRQLYQYHGASTGRWAARGVQVHNLPREMPKADVVERILARVRKGEHAAIDMIYGPPLTMLSKCLRSFFIASPGRKLIAGDFANIEGRGGAWFAGEDWKLQAYAAADDGTGPGVYELTYARAFNVPVESVLNPSEERQVGKVMDLSFLYQGGVGSGKTMGKTYGVKASDEKWDEWKELWRDAHPAIAGVRQHNPRTGRWFRKGGIWRAIETAAISAVQMPGEPFTCGHPDRQATYKMVGSFLWCLLPSGRVITYPYPKLLEGDYGPQLTFMCQPSPEDRKKGKVIYDEANSHKFVRVGTYGGSLLNNIVQGTCRDFLADLLLDLDAKGADIVLHTHDSAAIEVDDAKVEGARKAMQDMMRTPPAWAAGFPLFAECDAEDRFRG